jgi:acetyltransferase
MFKGDLRRMLHPEILAVIGASEKKESVGRTLLENLLQTKNERKIFPVNPARKKVLGMTCYPRIDDVPGHVDLALVATPAPIVPEIVEGCGQAEVDGMIIVSAGFREVGEQGRRLEEKVRAIRDRYGMRIIGPNCLGVILPHIGLNASILKVLPRAGNIAFISQSGALGGAIFDWAVLAHAGFSIFASLGSMIDVNYGDLVDFLSSDLHTRSIVIYMEEGIGDAKKFVSAVKGFARYKPIIAVKPGRFAEPPRSSLSHAGALVRSDQVYDAAFKRVSIVRVKEVTDLFNTVRVLQSRHLPKGPRLAVITNASGVGVMATDALIESGGQLASISEENLRKLDALLPPYWSRRNPVEVFRDADVERYLRVVGVFLDDPGVDGILIIYTLQDTPGPRELAQGIAKLAKSVWKPIVTAWIGGKEVQEGRDILFQETIPTFETPEGAVKAYLSMYHYERNLEIQYETPAELALDQAPPKNNLKAFVRRIVKEGTHILNEEDSNRFLTTYGIPTLAVEIAQNVEEAARIAGGMGYPVVLKIVSPDIISRKDVGGVVTGIHSEDELKEEFGKLLQRGRKYAPEARFLGVAIQKMIEKIDYEIFLGAKKDRDFGAVIVLGTGGTGVQVARNVSLGLPPLNQALARKLLEETEVYRMIQGYGLKPPANLRHLEEIIVSFSSLIVDFPEIAEMDINPIAIFNGRAAALASRIVIDPESLDHRTLYPHLVISPYPTRYVTSWRLPDGEEIFLRPVKPEDEPLLSEMLGELSPETMKERFFQTVKSITHDMLIRFCNIDYDREMTLVAEVRRGPGKKLIGMGGLMIEPDFKHGEFAIVIHDQYQGKGIGYKMLDALIGIAQEKELEEFYGIVLTDNRKMLRLCQRLGFVLHPLPDGITRAALALT